ncbi:MAG: hypothetical protein COB02_08230 [Candidatus Cloacimonadota bacterium]|nr:MAG: hypothetical protein COB02_08230 [Candidatus Cloacimonadota bacterium]
MTHSYLINFKNLELSYGKKTILKNVNFELLKGDYFFFLGKNGSGKSTLVQSIFSSTNISKGEIKKDKLIEDFSKIAYVPQFNNVNYELPIKVHEFVSLGKLNSKSKLNVDDMLKMVSMQDYKNEPINNLSGGQKQRLLLARAFIRDASLLIFDEPTNGLDVESKNEIFNIIHRFSKNKNISKIVITHDMNIAIHYGQKILYFFDKSVQVREISFEQKKVVSKLLSNELQIFEGLSHD